MNYQDLKKQLRPYLILANRKTTVNHAFASALAPHDSFAESSAKAAMQDLGQDPWNLTCVYCGTSAETWDHISAIVQNSNFSGYGHRIGNLVPCCKRCNSRKGNKPWRVYLDLLDLDKPTRRARVEAIERFLAKHSIEDQIDVTSPDYIELEKVRQEVLRLLAEADKLAARIRLQNTLAA